MPRFVVVIAVAAAVIGLTAWHLYALAMTIGIAVGAGMFLLGMAAGGGLGNARNYGQKPADVGARIGVALAAMGVAVEGLRDDHFYPAPFRTFCAVCQGLGALIAVVLAFRAWRAPTPRPERVAFCAGRRYTSQTMNVSVGAKTDTGRRTNNEDKLVVVDVRRHNLRADGVLIIADGMGGRNFGEKAADAAVETVCDTLVEMLNADHDPSVDVEDALDSALRKANARVYELAGSNSENQGMGTTCVAAVVENNHVYIAHAGDSRAYRWRKGELARLTDDHSYVAEQVRAGVITEENAKHSRFRNVIARAVGIEPTITPDVAAFDLEAGDALLLCTDGLTNMVPEDEIGDILAQAASSQAAADKLVTLANQNGGKDNITAIVARLEVGNKTQRMRANDLAQPATTDEEAVAVAQPAPVEKKAPEEHRNGKAIAESPPTPPKAKSRPPEYVEERAPAPKQKRSGGGAGAWLLAVLSILLLTSTLYLGNFLMLAGYHFQAAPPFVFKPKPPPPPKPPDLSRVAYGTPALLSVVPVRGDLLTHNGADDGLTVVTLSGQVLRLAPDGRTLFKYALPKRYAAPATSAAAANSPSATGSFGANPAFTSAAPPPAPGVYFANDSQGNLYVSDTALRTVTKFHANGDFIGVIASGKPKAPHALALKGPQALAVGKDGSVFVVDAQRLLAIPAKPPTFSP